MVILTILTLSGCKDDVRTVEVPKECPVCEVCLAEVDVEAYLKRHYPTKTQECPISEPCPTCVDCPTPEPCPIPNPCLCPEPEPCVTEECPIPMPCVCAPCPVQEPCPTCEVGPTTFVIGNIVWGVDWKEHPVGDPTRFIAVRTAGNGWVHTTITDEYGYFKVPVEPDSDFRLSASNGNVWCEYNKTISGYAEGTTEINPDLDQNLQVP